MSRPRLLLFLLFPVLMLSGSTGRAAPPVFVDDEPAADYDSLQTAMTAAVEAGELDAALGLAKRMAGAVQQRHVDALYELARIYALQGDAPRAYQYLDAAVEAGYWDVKTIREDEAFASLREDEYFKTLSRTAWANGYLAMLERDQREDFQKKEQILATLAFKPGERVADLGAGSGYFTIPIAHAVGPTGRVLAIDAVQNMLDYIQKRLWAEKLENVELVKVDKDDPQLPPGGVDTILMVDTYHYITERTAYGEKLRAGLAPGGRLVVIDYIPKSWEERPWGPPPSQHLSREQLSADLAAAGLREIASYDFLPEQFFVVYGAEADVPDGALAIPGDVKALILLDHQFGANLNTPVMEGSVNILEQLAGFGWEITLAGLHETLDSCSVSGAAFGSRSIHADRLVADVDDVGAYDCLIIPPGRGFDELMASEDALALVRSAVDEGLVVAAWCRAVRVLAAAGVLEGRRITGKPDYADEYTAAGAVYLGDGIPPVTDGPIVTTTRSRFYRTQMCEAIGRAVAARRRSVLDSGHR